MPGLVTEAARFRKDLCNIVKEMKSWGAKLAALKEAGEEITWIKECMAADMKMAAKIMNIHSMLKSRNYNVHVTIGLHSCSLNVSHLVLDKCAKPNLTSCSSFDSPRRLAIEYTRPRGLWTATGTLLKGIYSAQLVSQSAQRHVHTCFILA